MESTRGKDLEVIDTVAVHGTCDERFRTVRDSRYGNRCDGRRIAFWGGSGGSFVINDFDAHMTVAYVMNRHVESHDTDRRSIDIVCAAFDSLAAST